MKNRLLLIVLLCFSHFIMSAQKKADNPVLTFEKLWSEFNDRYANFELKQVEWNDTYKKYRPQITEHTTQKELFTISCSMLRELQDGHVRLDGEIDSKEFFCGVGNPFHIIEEFGSFDNLRSVVDTALNDTGFTDLQHTKEDALIQYSTSTDYGYLRIDDMEGYAIGEVKKSMTTAIEAFKNKKGVIIDVRFNGGGSDKVSYKIAGRFTDKERLGHYKKTRIKGTQDFTDLDAWHLKPKGCTQFTKPIIILTSDWSASATEIFLLAMKELPYVTQIGNTTEGIFSDMYPFRLPNGWIATLSNQQYFSAAMKNYEGIGIKPDIEILNYKKDETDLVLLKAIEMLGEK